MKGMIQSKILYEYNKYIRRHLMWWIVPLILITAAYFVLSDLGYLLLIAALVWIIVHVFLTIRKFRQLRSPSNPKRNN